MASNKELDQRTLRRNIRNVLAQATAEQRQEGRAWYQAAHTFAIGLSERYDVSVRQACGIIAALSPQTKWARNMQLADTMCRTGRARTLGNGWHPARAIYDGADPLDILHGLKTRAFFGNIVDPEHSTDVTIDRHACDLACGLRRGDAYRPELRKVGGYDELARAYRAVAKRLGMPAHVLQATTWLIWR